MWINYQSNALDFQQSKFHLDIRSNNQSNLFLFRKLHQSNKLLCGPCLKYITPTNDHNKIVSGGKFHY